MEDITALEQKIRNGINAAESLVELEKVRVFALGKKGKISKLLRGLGLLDKEDRKRIGVHLNSLKSIILDLLQEKQIQLNVTAVADRISQEAVDITLPVRSNPAERGRIHPISRVIDEIVVIFTGMGFSVASGPDIETDYYNFTALNFPPDHPAREMHDTFFLNHDEHGEQRLLRTHTSPVQIRIMKSQKPPFRIIIPGKAYRIDSDPTHSPMFHQVEGLVVDRATTIANMMWVLEQFCKIFFEIPSIRMRFRPSYFPFTIPSLEVDIQCARLGNEIRFGEGENWLEILGCGMVHPNVLRTCDLNPKKYQGFAWGMGVDRLAMLKYGMADLRAFFDTDIRWLEHYGFHPIDFSAFWSGLSR